MRGTSISHLHLSYMYWSALQVNEERQTWRAVPSGGVTASSLGTIAGGLGPWDIMVDYGVSALQSNCIDKFKAWCINSFRSMAGIYSVVSRTLWCK